MNSEQQSPSFWEFIYLHQWTSLFRPALIHVIDSLIEQSGRYRLLKYRYPMFIASTTTMHLGSFLTWDSSLIERICGMKRNLSTKNSRLLSIAECILSDFLWIYEQEAETSAEELQQEAQGRLIHSRHRIIHRKIVAVIRLIEWMLRLQWLRGKSSYPTVLCWLLRIRCQRLPPFSQMEWFPKAVLYFFYSLQFAEWWLAHADQFMAQEIPDPPVQIIESKSNDDETKATLSKKLADPGKCPLCKKEFANPTVITLTGVVYCYRCIHAYIERQHKCYVTGVPVTSSSVLRRVFVQ